jgi:2-dehydrotetronate isomerase
MSLRFAANLSFLYPELGFLQRFEAAASDGFGAVEFLFPYGTPRAEISAALKANGLELALFNAPPGGGDEPSWAAAFASGARGCAALAGRESEFRGQIEEGLRSAETLSCALLHVMAGVVALDAAALAVYQNNLAWATRLAAQQGVTLSIEPLNPRDVPGYALRTQAQAHAVVQSVREATGLTNIGVQFDLYHCQATEGDVTTKLREYLPSGRVAHMQVASVPARHEPGSGELNWPHLAQEIETLGYRGHMGAEYRPADPSPGGTTRGLKSWFTPLVRAASKAP